MEFFKRVKNRKLEKFLYDSSLEIFRRVKEDYKAGLSEKEIADKFNFKDISEFRKMMYTNSMCIRMESTRRFLKLRDKGYSHAEIAKRLKMPLSLVTVYIEKFGDLVTEWDKHNVSAEEFNSVFNGEISVEDLFGEEEE